MSHLSCLEVYETFGVRTKEIYNVIRCTSEMLHPENGSCVFGFASLGPLKVVVMDHCSTLIISGRNSME